MTPTTNPAAHGRPAAPQRPNLGRVCNWAFRPGALLDDFCDPATPFKPPRTVFSPGTLILLLFSNISRRRDMLTAGYVKRRFNMGFNLTHPRHNLLRI